MKQILFKFSLLIIISLLITSCESEDADLLFQAETCINEKSETGSIGQCQQFLESLSSQRANTLKCTIQLELSGLSNSKIIDALEIMNESTESNNEAHFMGLVSLNSIEAANESAQVCSDTESPGLEFIAQSARMGTYFANEINRVGTINEGNPLTVDDLTCMLVGTNGGGTGCSNDGCDDSVDCKEALGASAQSMFAVYCNDSTITDVDVCSDVRSAIDGGGTNEAIGSALIGLLEN